MQPTETPGEQTSVAASVPVAPPSRGSLVMEDVFLLTADGDEPMAVPRLALVLDRAGVVVRRPDGAVGATVPWSEVTTVSASGRMHTPEGGTGVVVEAVTASRVHRFLVPTGDSEGLERDVARVSRAMSRRSKGTVGRPSPSRLLVAGLGVLVIAVIALIVLFSTGTVKF